MKLTSGEYAVWQGIALMGDDRRELVELLARHGRITSIAAINRGQGAPYSDFMKMRGALLAGGLHRVRLYGGRGL